MSFALKMLKSKYELKSSQGIRVRLELPGAVRLLNQETQTGAGSFKKNPKKSVEDTGLFQRVVGTVLGDGAQGLARKLHTDVATAATVELGHPYTLLLKVGVDRTVDSLGDVTTDTALLLGKTGAMNAAALMRHGKRDIADSGHKIFYG